jgi:hypothetical protein
MIVLFKYEDNPFKYSTVIAAYIKNQENKAFDIEGHGHLWMKVKFCLVFIQSVFVALYEDDTPSYDQR